MIETFDENTPTTKSEPTPPPLGLVPFDLVESVIYRDEHRHVYRDGTKGRVAPSAYTVQDSNKPDSLFLEHIRFQPDAIKNVGVQGATNECLLAMVIDRLRCFQQSPFACDENAAALEFCEAALERLEDRTRRRKARGVDGTHTP